MAQKKSADNLESFGLDTSSRPDTSSRSETMGQDNEEDSKGSRVVYQNKSQERKKVTQVVFKAPKKVAQKFKSKRKSRIKRP